MLKKILLATSLIISTFISYSLADCIDFTAWNVCINIQNQWNWYYKVTKTFTNKGTYKNMYILTCSILTPDNKLKDLWTCEKSFQYNGSWKKQVTIYVRLETEKKNIKMSYNFVKINSTEKSTIEKFYKSWDEIVDKLIAKYPSLKTNKEWNTLADKAYENIQNYYYWKDSKISSYQEFKNIIIDFIAYTKKSVK